VNPAFEAVSGYALAEVIGRNCPFPAERRPRPAGIACLREAVAAGLNHTCTLRNYRKDGRLFWSRMHVYSRCATAGAIVNFAAFLEDVSAAVEAQAEVANAREHLSTVLESISDGCFSLDRDWRFTYINSKGAAWLGAAGNCWARRSGTFPGSRRRPLLRTYRTRNRAPGGSPAAKALRAAANLARGARLSIEGWPDGLLRRHHRAQGSRGAPGAHGDPRQPDRPAQPLQLPARARRPCLATDSMVGVLFIDLDHFKEVNDAHGHQPATWPCRRSGAAWPTFEDADTTVSRISGDEFVIVLANAERRARRRRWRPRCCSAWPNRSRSTS
jgi:PAS domain S-box-containing protein